MSEYPLHALRDLLRVPESTRGVVVRVTDGRVHVATARGLRIVATAQTLAVGQTVMIRDGAAYPAAVAGRVYAL